MEEHIYIYNEIGEGGITVQQVQDQIKDSEADQIIVHISSPGGEVYEGWAIGNVLKNSGKKVIAEIEGMCASIATYIALQADKVRMSETAMFMIHNPSTMVMGEKKDLEGEIRVLDQIKDDLVRTYRKKTGLSQSQISKMMDDETHMSSLEAKNLKFVDEIIKPSKAVAYIKSKNIDKMPKDNETTIPKDGFQKIINEWDSFINTATENIKKLTGATKPKNVLVTLEDGTPIFVVTEDGEFEGKTAYLADADGERTDEFAPEGNHRLNDGRIITVGADGVIESVSEDGSEPDAQSELENKIKELEAKLGEKDTEIENLKQENKKELEQITENVNKEVSELKNKLKNTVAGLDIDATKANNPMGRVDDKPAKAHPMDNFAKRLVESR